MKISKFFSAIIAVICLLMFASNVFAGSTTLHTWLNKLPNGKYYGLPLVVTMIDPAAASATAFKDTAISTATLVSAATTFTLAYADYTDIIQPRNVVAQYACSYATTTALTSCSGSLLITGTNAIGNAATETLTVSTTAATGSVVWRTITSMVLTTTAISKAADVPEVSTVNIQIGSGVKMDLPLDMVAATNVKKCIEAGVLTTTYTLDLTYNSITFVNAPDGSKDYILWLDNR